MGAIPVLPETTVLDAGYRIGCFIPGCTVDSRAHTLLQRLLGISIASEIRYSVYNSSTEYGCECILQAYAASTFSRTEDCCERTEDYFYLSDLSETSTREIPAF